MELFKLFGRVLIDNDEANKSLDSTDKKAEGVGKRLKSTIATAAKWGAGIAAGAATAGAALFGVVNRAVEVSAEINKISQVVGFSREGFQQWDFVMKNFGFSMEQASGDLAALAERALDAANGAGEGAELFGMLGVSVTDTSGKMKSQEQIFGEVITTLQGMEDITKRNAIATALLGTTGEELGPILNMTNKELEAMKANANIIPDSSIERAEKFRMAWNRAREMFSGLVTQIGLSVLPMFEGLLNFVVRQMPKIPAVFEFVGDVAAAVWKGVGNIIGATVDFLRTVVIDPFIGWLAEVWRNNQESLATIARAAWENIVAVFNIFKAAFQGDWAGAWEATKEAARTIWNNLPVIFENAINVLINVADSIMSAIIGVIRSVFGDEVGDIFQTAWDAVVNIFEGARDIVLGIWRAINAALKGDWSGAWEEIKGVARTAWDTITGTIETALELVNTILDGAMNGVVELVRWAFGDQAASIVEQGFGVVRTLVQGATDVILGIIRTFSALFAGDWSGAWEEAKGVLSTAWDTITAAIEGALDFIVNLLGTVRSSIVEIVRGWFGDEVAGIVDNAFGVIVGIVEGARDLILAVIHAFNAAFRGDWQAVWGEVKSIPEKALAALSGIVQSGLNAVSGVINGILDGIVTLIRMAFGDRAAEVVNSGFQVIRTVIANAQDLIVGAINTLLALVRGEWGKAWETLVSTVKGVWDRTIGLVDDMSLGVRKSVVNFVLRLVDTFKTGKDLVIDQVRDMIEGVQEWFGNTKLGKAVGFVQDAVGKVTGFFADMYDAVVGHSYVPDMVREIGEETAKLGGLMVTPTQKFTEAVKGHYQTMTTEIGDAYEKFNERLSQKTQEIRANVTAGHEALRQALDETNKGIVEDAEKSTKSLTSVWSTMSSSLSGSVKSGFRTMFDVMREGEGVFAGLKAGLKEIVLDTIQLLEQQVITSQLAGIAAAWSQAPFSLGASLAWIPQIISGVGPALLAFEAAKAVIRALADGGKIIKDGLALVGERGPELVSLPKGASVLPLDNKAVANALASLVRPGPAPMTSAAVAGGAGGFGTANIIIELDGRTLAREIGQPLIDELRIRTGLKL